MMLHLSIYSLIVFQLFDTSSTYTFRDTDSWSIEYPQCGAENQSPINIVTSDTKSIKYDQNLQFYHMDQTPNKYTLTNTGKGLQLIGEWDDDKIPMMNGGPLGLNEYIFSSIEFYWSPKLTLNNVHKINGKGSPLEMHAAFFKKDYGSPELAKKYDDGLAIMVGFWGEWVYEPNEAMLFIVSKLFQVTHPGNVTSVIPFNILELFDDSSNPPLIYYSYVGSEVKPPCAPALWFIQNYTNSMIPIVLSLFREVQFDNDDISNVRPVQPLEGRVVYELESNYV